LDYYGDGVGIRVSRDLRTCWAIGKRSQGRWIQYGDHHPIADLSAFDAQTGSPDSPLKLAWTVLGYQKPQAQSDLRELISAAKKEAAEGG
jgi:hypothetical protein